MSNLSKQAAGNRIQGMGHAIDLNILARIIAFPFLIAIRFYQLFSPIKQLILGPYARCRFHPTCSEYALQCFQTLPIHRAIPRSLYRIFKCNPMHPGGFDPVHQDCNQHPYADQ